MSTTNKILSVLLVLMLAGSSMSFSGHITSHAPMDSGMCSLCVHAGGLDDAITTASATFFAVLATQTLGRAYSSTLLLPAPLQYHQSRAPPKVT